MKWLQHGVLFNLAWTQFGQGTLSGSGSHDWQYGGRVDAGLLLDWSRMKGPKGLATGLGFELRYGDSLNFTHRGEILFPVNTALLFPAPEGTRGSLTSLYFVQTFNPESTLVFGRLNLLELAASDPYTGGNGLDQFMNISFLGPLIALATTPVTTIGAIYTNAGKPLSWSFGFYDPNDSSLNTGLERPFADGVTFNAALTLPNKKGLQSLGSFFTTRDSVSLASIPQLILPILPEPIVLKNNSWAFAYTFEYAIQQNRKDPRKMWGAFGYAGISDGDPNPVRWSAVVGLAGANPSRPQDNLGVGFFYAGISSAFKNDFHLLHVGDEFGAELFYNWQPTHGLKLGADLQIISPSLAGAETAAVAGLRGKLTF
jgi:porin